MEDVIATLRARVAELEQQQQWREIDTAAKDGSWLLGWLPDEARSYALRWDTNGRSQNPAWRDHELFAYQPTHWMPLPAPPRRDPPEQP